MKRSALIAATSLLCLALPALAEDSATTAAVENSASEAPAKHSGVYLGAGMASGSISSCANTVSNTCNTFTGDSQDSAHPRLIVGYDFSKYVGIEAGMSQLGSYKMQTSTGLTAGTVKASAITLAAKGGYTFPHGFSIFGKLGLASVNTKYTADPGWILVGDANRSSSGLVFGAGGQYDLNDTVGFRLFTEMVFFDDGAYTSGVSGTTLMAVVKF